MFSKLSKIGSAKQDLLAIGAIFLWPFAFFFRYVIPNQTYSRFIGNDFIDLYYLPKVYLLDKLSSFDFPFWSPSEAAGYPFHSSPFNQAFYPLNLILAVLYRLLGGTRLLTINDMPYLQSLYARWAYTSG